MDLLQSNSPALAEVLDAETMEVIEHHCTWRWFDAGQIIHLRGDRTHGFSLIRSGRVSVSNVGLDGSEVTNSVLGPGQWYGEFTLFAGLPRTHNISALEEVEIGTVKEKVFKRLCDEHPAILKALLTISLRRSYGLVEFLDSLRRQPLDMRVAQLLLNHVRNSQQSEVDCKQEDLAFTLGVTRVSIGKVLSKLEQAGLIHRGYGKITVADPSLLASWVEDRRLVTPLSATSSR
tara:strand:+ start:399 stop:1097 length:699 start_codon:yes stop_codon:yes gene_type:complete